MMSVVVEQRRTSAAAPLLRSALAATVFLSVLFGVGLESAFAQKLGKVQKSSVQKRTIEALPKIMNDPPTYVTPPAEVIGELPRSIGGSGIWFPSPVQGPQPGPSNPGSLPGGGGSGGGSGSTATTTTRTTTDSCYSFCKCLYL